MTPNFVLRLVTLYSAARSRRARNANAPISRRLRVEALEKRELLDAASGLAPIEAFLCDARLERGVESNVVANAAQALVVTTAEDVVDLDDGLLSLREAIAEAGKGDSISFAPSLDGATLTLEQGELLVGKSITIDASGLESGLTIDAGQQSRVFKVHSSSGTIDVEFKSLTITGGKTTGGNDSDGGAGVYNQGENLTLSNCAVVGNNISSSFGGGIYNSGRLTITGGTVSENTINPERANAHGGGIYSIGYATLVGVEFSQNKAAGQNDAFGGAIYASGEFSATDCVFRENGAEGQYSVWAGAVFIREGSTASIVGCEFTGNGALHTTEGWNVRGGAICTRGITTVDNSTFTNNSVEGKWAYGGAIDNYDGTLEVKNSVFTKNTTGTQSGAGGAIFSRLGSLTLSEDKFTSNSSQGNGGAVFAERAGAEEELVFTSLNCDYTENASNEAGGAIFITDMNSTIQGGVFEGNETRTLGGAIFSRAGTLALSEDNFTTNSSQGNGGAIYVERGGSEGELVFTSINCDYTENASNDCGGAIFTHDMKTTLQDAEFKNNTARSLGGAIRFTLGTTDVSKAIFTGNKSTESEGGAIQVHQSDFTVTDCEFTENASQGYGGAIRVYNALFTIAQTDFTGNTANNQGGAIKTDDCPTLAIDDCDFVDNAAQGTGGAIQIWNSETLTVTNAEFTGNTSEDWGGAAYLRGTTVVATDLTFEGNAAKNNGGAFVLSLPENATGRVERISASGNSANNGGGLYFELNEKASATLTDATVENNLANSFGGGIYTSGGKTQMTRVDVGSNVCVNNDGGGMTLNGANVVVNSIIHDNSAYHGGAIRSDGDLELRNVVLSSNAAQDNGGGIYHCNSNKSLSVVNSQIIYNKCLVRSNGSGGAIEAYGETSIVNSTLAGNEVSENGGAIWYNKGLSLLNVTIAYNTAKNTGGGILQDGGTFTSTNSIISGNLAPTSSDVRLTGVSDSYNNVVGISEVVDGLENGKNGNLVGASEADPVDAYLGPITKDAEGRYFIPIASFSPAVDAAKYTDKATSDGLGRARYDASKSNSGSGAIKYADVGAWEYRGEKPEGEFNDYDRGVYFALAVDSKNYVYATDLNAGVVRVFDASGKQIKTIGTWGEEDGRLVSPRGVALGDSGALYVVDATGRVQVFDANGDYARTIGANDNLTDPQGICYDAKTKRLYVVDAGTNRVLCYSSTGSKVWAIGGTAKSDHTGFNNPTSVAVHPTTGQIWIADCNNDRIEIYDANGKYSATKEYVSRPTSIAFDSNGNLFYGAVAEATGKKYYEGRLGVLRDGQTFSGPHFFGGLDDLGRITRGIAVRPNGDVLLVDQLNRRIVQTTATFDETTSPTSFDAFTESIVDLDIDANGTEAIFTWKTNLAAGSYVKIGESTHEMEIVASSVKKTTSHSITVSDLTPNSVLYYSVGYLDSFNNTIRWTDPQKFNTGVEVGQKQILRLKTLTILYTDANFSESGYTALSQAEQQKALGRAQRDREMIYQGTRCNVWLDNSATLLCHDDLTDDSLSGAEEFARSQGYSINDDFDVIIMLRPHAGGGVGGSGFFLDRWVGFGNVGYWAEGLLHELNHAFDFAIYGEFLKYDDCHKLWQIIDTRGFDQVSANLSIYGSLLDANYTAVSGAINKIIVVPDADDDGLPDDSPKDQGLSQPLPFTEKTLRTSTSKKDTDADGLTDLEEACLLEFGGSVPNDPDTNGNGVKDGDDLNPVYVMNGAIKEKTPRLDGVVSEDAWTLVLDHYGYPNEYPDGLQETKNDAFSLYSAWDEDYLYLGVKANGAFWVNIWLDGGCDNYFLGQDNLAIAFGTNWGELYEVYNIMESVDGLDIYDRNGGNAYTHFGMSELRLGLVSKEDILSKRTHNQAFDVYDWEIGIPWNPDLGFTPYDGKLIGIRMQVEGADVFNCDSYAKLQLHQKANLNFTLSNASVEENAPVGTVVGVFAAVNAAVGAPTYSIVDSSENVNANCFRLEGDKLVVAKSLDFESQPTSKILVRADFGEWGTQETFFDVATLDVEEQIDVTISGWSGTYDRQPHTIVLTGVQDGDVVAYSVDGETWADDAPSFVNAGDYLVYAKISRPGSDPMQGSARVQIAPRSVTVSIRSVNVKQYDGTTKGSGSYTLTGVLSGDSAQLIGGAFLFDDPNVGANKSVVFTDFSFPVGSNYQATNSSATYNRGEITPRDVQFEWKLENEYVYNGTSRSNSVTATYLDVSGARIPADVAFENDADPLHAGEYVAIASINSTNYRAGNNSNATRTITIKPASLKLAFSPISRVYDGGLNANFTYTLQGAINGDQVELLSANCQFDTKDVGKAKTVTLSDGALSNSDYQLEKTSYSVATGEIIARPLSLVGWTILDKTYDGSTDASFRVGKYDGLVKGDHVVVAAKCKFPDAAPGNYELTATFTKSGVDAKNYAQIPSMTQTAAIKPGANLDKETYRVQEGAAFFADVAAQGGSPTDFEWSIDGKPLKLNAAALRFDPAQLPVAPGEHVLAARARVNDVWSDPAQGTLVVDHVAPSISVVATPLGTRGIRLDLEVFPLGGRAAQYGVVQWGDGQTTEFRPGDGRAFLAHLYADSNKAYDVTLDLFESSDEDCASFYLTSYGERPTEKATSDVFAELAVLDELDEFEFFDL